MAAKTPDANSRQDNVVGHLRAVSATFASVTASDTWATGLGVITSCLATAGNAAAETTVSGGTVTFTNTGTNYHVRVTGY